MHTENGKKVLTMAEYIKREDLLELYRIDDPVLNENGHVPLTVIRQNIMDIPAADVAPVMHGRWEIVVGSNGKEYMVCTCCRVSQDLTGVFSYCPNCGAKMDGGAD